MTTPTAITNEVQKLAPSAIIELFKLDCTDLGGAIYYFHAGTNALNQNIVWNGQEYTRFPIHAEGFDFVTNGQIPRPKLKASNILGTITSLVLQFQDLVGAKITRRRTFARFLDAVNFPGSVNPSADPTAEHTPDVYFVDRKISEDYKEVSFGLTAAFDLQGIALPRRQVIQNLCPWVYRSSECSYAGSNYFKADDTSTTDSAQDTCGKRLSSCKKRFGTYGTLPFGGMPGSGLQR